MSKEYFTGRIKFWNGVKNYGFIKMKTDDATEDVFFSTSALVDPFCRPFRGDRVRFQLEGQNNSLRAVRIERVEMEEA